MERGSMKVTEVARSVQLLEIEGFSVTKTMVTTDCIKCRWTVDGYDWEVRLYPCQGSWPYYVALQLYLLSEVRVDKVRARLNCRLVHPRRIREPSDEKSASTIFSSQNRCSSKVFLIERRHVPASGYLEGDTLTVECTITVLKEQKDITLPSMNDDVPLPMPPSDMPQHLGNLLQSKMGADVTFTVSSGESFAAHKNILAARSPVFMAEFFGHMKERRSMSVVVKDMAAPVFSAILHLIYTDTVPELDLQGEDAMAMAQHLVAAADRYGLDRLKLICESKLYSGISVDTAAATLALAEQHSCSELKAKGVDFISRSRENLDAVLATEGYKNLEATCPFVLTELLKATHARKN